MLRELLSAQCPTRPDRSDRTFGLAAKFEASVGIWSESNATKQGRLAWNLSCKKEKGICEVLDSTAVEIIVTILVLITRWIHKCHSRLVDNAQYGLRKITKCRFTQLRRPSLLKLQSLVGGEWVDANSNERFDVVGKMFSDCEYRRVQLNIWQILELERTGLQCQTAQLPT